MIRQTFLGATAALALTVPAAAQDLAITGATIATGDGSAPIENATVVIRNGRVIDVGADVDVPGGIPTLDGSGTWVSPGLVAAVTDLGLVDVSAVQSSNDISASSSRFNARTASPGPWLRRAIPTRSSPGKARLSIRRAMVT